MEWTPRISVTKHGVIIAAYTIVEDNTDDVAIQAALTEARLQIHRVFKAFGAADRATADNAITIVKNPSNLPIPEDPMNMRATVAWKITLQLKE